jgi:hypothetical protein
MADFNIRQLIREVLRSSTMADPSAVADEVMRRIPKNMIRAALAQVLRDVVRQVMGEERQANRGGSSVTAEPQPTQPALRIADGGDEPPAKPVPNRSWKRVGISDGWQKRLMDRVHVGQSAQDWKLLKFCTYEDLLFAANERRGIADSNNAAARQYDAWARLLTEHDVATFGDLPAEAQMSALGRAA